MNAPVSLDDKYNATQGRVFLSGTQALVRLPMTQMRRDKLAGLNTASFISGYRGSPLGAYDQQIQLAAKHLAPHQVHFTPGINEELAATAVWGTQQSPLFEGSRVDGVLGIWYGKGPGVDRTGDVFKHANAAGTSQHGGVLALAGDDHTCKSSTVPHQSDHAFISANMPLLYPSSVQEFLEYGLFGIAMSRFSGLWTGFKVISDTVETSSVISLDGEMRKFVTPDYEFPLDGVHIRWPDPPLVQDERLLEVKMGAALAFAQANKVNEVTKNSPDARLGIAASGKAYEDVLAALSALDIGPSEFKAIGLRLMKIRMVWPLEPQSARDFATGLQELFVIEERREIVEDQFKQLLFNLPSNARPRVIGKFDENGTRLLPTSAGLRVETVAQSLGQRILQLDLPEGLQSKIKKSLKRIADATKAKPASTPVLRTPYFCAGCPHNTSTRVPKGSKAIAGIGCHYMTVWMDRDTETFTQMGGDGVPWVGLSEFMQDEHRFANMGDGTYVHSGYLAIRQAVSASVNMTYKILYNDAVAMTGGQTLDGTPSPARITRQLAAEGVSPIYLLSDEPALYQHADLAKGVIVKHRDHLDPVMLELRETKGVSAIVYVQTCAAEKRRRRKRGDLVDPDKRVFIHPDICEGCGDCSVQSNCVAIEPLETPMGRKRQINQSSCNKDFSCVNGFCPAFVTLNGAAIKKPKAQEMPSLADLPMPRIVEPKETLNIAVAGIGGTGVLTIGSVLGMACHIDRLSPLILDQAGLAQKGGSVFSHIRIAPRDKSVDSPRIPLGKADIILAADTVVAASTEGSSLCSAENTMGIVNAKMTPVSDFIRDRDFDFRATQVENSLRKVTKDNAHFHDFSAIAKSVLGDEIAANTMMLGYAFQLGLLPLSLRAIETAIELNGVAIQANLNALSWGRLLAHDSDAVLNRVQKPQNTSIDDMTLDEIISLQTAHLTRYQNKDLSKKYQDKIANLRSISDDEICKIAAANYAKLLAYKDEYEVARLLSDSSLDTYLDASFVGKIKKTFNLAPPILSRKAPNGRPAKREISARTRPILSLLAKAKFLRGTAFDPFGRQKDRQDERRLIRSYEQDIELVQISLSPSNRDLFVSLLSLPQDIRGFGPVKENAIKQADEKRRQILEKLEQAPANIAAE